MTPSHTSSFARFLFRVLHPGIALAGSGATNLSKLAHPMYPSVCDGGHRGRSGGRQTFTEYRVVWTARGDVRVPSNRIESREVTGWTACE